MKKNFVGIGTVLIAVLMLVVSGFSLGMATANLGANTRETIRSWVDILLIILFFGYGFLCVVVNDVAKKDKINQKENGHEQ